MTDKNTTRPRPRRRWSQNFLTDPNIARKIARSLTIGSPALIIEIGAGQGMLTQFLIPRAQHLIAIEIDPGLAEELPTRMGEPSALGVLRQDFIEWDLGETLSGYSDHHRAIIGNLPYHITSPIIFKILDHHALLEQAVFMIQKEVARRIAARPASKEYGILSVLCQFYARVEYLFSVPAHLFFPRPKVDSAVIRLNLLPNAESQVHDPILFREIVRHTFGQRRKMLRNTLSHLYPGAILQQLNTDLTRRPEQLSVKEFADLSNQLHQLQPGEDHEQTDPRHGHG